MISNVYLMYQGVNHVRLAGFKGMIARLPNFKVIIDAGKEIYDSPESINEYLQNLIGIKYVTWHGYLTHELKYSKVNLKHS